MNLQETVALIEALRSAGVTKFKSHEHDIVLSEKDVAHIRKPTIDEPHFHSAPHVGPIANPEATQRAMDLINTLKMSPEELANQMFPDGAI